MQSIFVLFIDSNLYGVRVSLQTACLLNHRIFELSHDIRTQLAEFPHLGISAFNSRCGEISKV